MSNRNYPKWFIDSIHNECDKIKAINGELKSTDKCEFICVKGHVYNILVNNRIVLLSGEEKRGCPICSKIQRVETLMKNKKENKYPEWFMNDLVYESDKEIIKSGLFNTKDKFTFKCDKGHVYEQAIYCHINLKEKTRKQGCPICAKELRKLSRLNTGSNNRNYPKWFIDSIHNECDKIKAINGELKYSDVIEFNCNKCNTIYKISVNNRIYIRSGKEKRGCPFCSEKDRRSKFKDTFKSKRKEYPDWFINELANDTDKVKAKNKELTTNDIVEFKCGKGHTYKQSIHLHLNGCKCPKCSNNRSKIELEIEDYIKSFGLCVEHKRIGSNRKYEIDILIPEKNVGIEYNGSYYHKTLPSDEYSKPKLYHQEKFNECKKNGIHLITIFDVDWDKNSDKIKSYLENIFSSKERIYARKCEVKEITFNEANNLYIKYHLLGKLGMSNVNYGLFFNNELVSCMSFQEKRYKEGWCLCRFVTNNKYLVVGGASKLFSTFIKNYNPEKVISFSDNDYFTGRVYEKLGFKNSGSTYSPRYYWYLDCKELNREKCQLKKLKIKYPILYKEAISQNEIRNKENYIMLKLGALKVYRSGHTKWIWDNKC